MQERWREQQMLASYFGDVVRGMSVLKSFNRSGDAVANLDAVGVSLRRTTMSTLRVAFLSGFALELLSSLATALVALVLGLRLLNGSLGLNVALAVLLLTPEVFLPLRRSAAQYHASSEGIAAATDLLASLDNEVATGTGHVANEVPRIELEDLVVGHEGRSHHRDALRASIGAGSLVLITGPSGSGKTTLLRVIAGLRTPEAGRILIDGVDLAALSLAQWHARVAWLPQDPLLPGHTIRDVVQMGDEGMSEVRIVEAMKVVGLELDLERPLGEGAGELSAGQRRRLALVRCLVRDPVVLLLDEPTAHLDSQSANLVREAINSLTMTRIVATHQTFTCDQVIEIGVGVRHGI
jgi:ATP-binding cassette subfamily C protein CydCD